MAAGSVHPRLSPRLDPVRADPDKTCRDPGPALDRLRQYRRADRPVLAGRGGVLRAVAGHRRDHALLLAVSAGRGFCHPDFPVVVRPSRAGLAVRGADAVAVLYAPREYPAIASGERGADRGEV